MNHDDAIIREDSLGFRIELQVLKLLQSPWASLHESLYPIVRKLFELRGVDYYIVDRTAPLEERNAREREVFDLVQKILTDAIEIKVALGEVGHQFMEHPAVLEGLSRAFIINSANIEIVHGPRVDPKTTSIFSFARQDVVRLFKMDNYESHHFILVKKRDGDVILVDEGVHVEAIWSKDKSGDRDFSSDQRYYFVTSNKPKVIQQRKNEFTNRKNKATEIKHHPNLNSPQNRSVFRLTTNVLFDTVYGRLKQTISLLLDAPSPLKLKPMEVDLQQEEDKQISNLAFMIVDYDEVVGILILLKAFDVLTLDELSERLISNDLSTDNLTHLLDQLREMAIVTEKPKNSYQLTTNGKNVADALNEAIHTTMDELQYAR